MILSGGGTSVLAADDLATAGLELPPLPDDVREELAKHIPIAGTSIRNPVDVNMFTDNPALPAILDTLGNAPNVDALLFHASFNWNLPGDPEEKADVLADRLKDAREAIGKPCLVVAEPGRELHQVKASQLFTKLAWERGFPVFSSPLRAANAYARVFGWHAERD
jgi:acyl-CoA synthetase (NDP forming)